jgi:hypothetical protein
VTASAASRSDSPCNACSTSTDATTGAGRLGRPRPERHTYASLLIADTQNALVVMARLGHASITERMDTYGHLFPQSHAETTATLDRAFAGAAWLRAV